MSKPKKKPKGERNQKEVRTIKTNQLSDDLSKLEELPVTYQAVLDFFRVNKVDPVALRKETFLRIEKITGRPLICYVTKTHNPPKGSQNYINDFDLTGFNDLVSTVTGDSVDIFIMSNGGEVEATERIVNLIHERFNNIRFIVPSNAFSAATLLCFSGDEIIMDTQAALGPIDPQMNGIPVQAILQAFNKVKKEVEERGVKSLVVYWPLIAKYDLHLLEIGENFDALSKQLAENWLSKYMLKCSKDDVRVRNSVGFFSAYDTHKSHGRSINREMAYEYGLNVRKTEDIEGLQELVRSLYNQYVLWFDKTPFVKNYENRHGINWGWQAPILVPTVKK